MTDTDLNAEIRLLCTGDDGSVEFNSDRLSKAVSGWLRSDPSTTLLHNGNALFLVQRSRGVEISRILVDLGAPILVDLYVQRHSIKTSWDWQQALESHVAAYREPAPDYDEGEVVEMCRRRGVRIERIPCVSGYAVRTSKRSQNLDHVDCIYAELKHTVKLVAVEALREETPNA